MYWSVQDGARDARDRTWTAENELRHHVVSGRALVDNKRLVVGPGAVGEGASFGVKRRPGTFTQNRTQTMHETVPTRLSVSQVLARDRARRRYHRGHQVDEVTRYLVCVGHLLRGASVRHGVRRRG